ncbi:MAG: hypothetical protein OHK0021_06550 [Bryobacter sp.]
MKVRFGPLLFALILLGFPAISQEPEGIWFALNSNASVEPGEEPIVGLSAQNLRQLEFRLYRINDAGSFLSQLRDPHSFGNRVADLPRERTPLERFYRWKRRVRNDIVQYTRRQFTAATRAAWRERSVKPESTDTPKKGEKGTTYAPVAILNEKQLLKTWTETISTRERWAEQNVKVPVREAGFYLVEATDGKLRAYTIVSISPIAILSKTQPGTVWTRVVERQSGAPLAGVDVEFRSGEDVLAKTKTDENGLAKYTGEARSGLLALATRQQNGKAEIALDAINEWAFGREEGRRLTAYLYTERPVYRPGHKVFFKAVLRQQLDQGYALPKASEADVEITDSDGKSIYKKTLRVSSFGSVEGSLELPMTASLGYYGISLRAGEGHGYGGFNVEEYKKPEYAVKITPTAPRVLQGEAVSATIEARYYFGEPVRDAKVKYTIRRQRYYPSWYESDSEGYETTEEDNSGGEYFRGEQGEEVEGRLDSEGRLTIKLPTPVESDDYTCRIEARVMDEGNREVTGYGMAIATRGNYYVSVRSDRYIGSPGQAMDFTVTAKDYDGQPQAVAFRTLLERYEYNQESASRYKTVGASVSGTTGADGTGKVSVMLPTAGSYRLTVLSRSPQGRDLRASDWVWTGGGFGGSYDDEESLKIISDKKKYAPGETAKLLLLAPPGVNAWLTTEYRGIVDSRIAKSDAQGQLTAEIPIRAEYAPNITVTAAFLKQGKLYQGRATLRVPPAEKELALTVTPVKAEFKPGEPARYDVVAKDHRGQPVRAEISLGVVDEALYAVQRETVQTPLSFFYGNIYSDVSSSSSLRYYFRNEAGTRAMRLAQIRPSLGQLKPERVGDPRVRKAFPDTAFWVANLLTDASGRGQVEFAFPDALTQWRTTARAFTEDTKVGFALNRVTVRKNLLLRPVAPRFLMEGDEVSLGVVVQNYLASAKPTKVTLSATGVDLLDGAERSITVDSKGTRKVEFRVRVKPGAGDKATLENREAVITAKALTDEESDAVEITLPIKPYGTLLSSGQSGALTDGKKASFSLAAPGTNRSLELSVAPSLAGSLLGSLEYLSTFPYGCTEQTMSSFLPNITVTKVLNELGVRSNLRREDLQKKVDAGLERLYDYQHADGAWGWWKDDESHPFMTAHVLAGLKEARAAGYSVNQNSLERAQQWLQGEFRRQDKALPDLRAYIAYALGTQEAANVLYADRNRMTAYGKAFLGLALDQRKDARAKTIAEELAASAQQNEGEAWWPSSRDELLDFDTDSTPETTSFALKLLSRQLPASPLLPKAATWLVLHRDQGQWWNSTKQTAMVIYGLLDYLKVSKELAPSFRVRVRVGGREVLSKEFASADLAALTPTTLRLPAAESNNVEVEMSGAGRLYWNAQTQYFTSAEQRVAGGSAMSVAREYYRLVPREQGGNTRYALEPLNGPVAPGDAIAVLVRTNAPNRKYLLIEDPIPAGFEHAREGDYNLVDRPIWWAFNWARTEYRDDRAAFFRTYYFGDEDKLYFYVLKAVNPGKFRVPPPRLQPMYEPKQVATGRANTLEVQ